MSNSYWFYHKNYIQCDYWLQKHGFFGLKPISKILYTEQIDYDQNKVEEYEDLQSWDDVIDPEYLKAIEITRKHQKDRNRQSQQENSDKWFNYIDFSQTESYSIQSKALKDDDDIANIDNKQNTRSNTNLIESDHWYRELYHTRCEKDKLNKYCQLYGHPVDENTILKNVIQKENELYYNFERFCDENQPKFWPILPIRIKWSK